MNEEMQAKIVEMLTALQSEMASGVAFAKEQFPLVMQEMLRWGFLNQCIVGGVALALLSILIIGFTKLWWLQDKTKVQDIKEASQIFMGIICFLSFLCLCIVINAINTGVKIKVAPRVCLIEQLPKLINK
jgi:hypothetical protein